ncbi:MAG: DUF4249 domain-containing protein [Flavobacteriales bacterium]|nr:DUF4249 domain-containing protein [Flavobacteriales bacterium]MCB0758779.1 DUF4249 family protein [Flavobacteriales bacterium]
MSLRPFFLVGIAGVVLSACNSDLDITAPYKENTIVYAMLDKDSSTQYVKINKAFLGPGDAFTYAQVPDSTEYTDDQLQAVVQEVKNGNVVNTYALHDTLLPHDPGIFAGPLHKLYYFNASLDSSATYRFEATAKGNHVSAQTSIVAKINPTGAILSQPLRLIAVGGGYATQTIRWNSSENGKRYDVSYRFRWDDVEGNDTIPRSFTQSLGSYVSNGLGGGEAMEAPMDGETFFQTVGYRAGDSPNVTRRIYRGVDILWAVAGPDLHLYLQLNSPISGLVEDRPTYTNVTDGYGLFSTRRFLELPVNSLSSNTIPELVQGQYTAGLNFCVPFSADFGCD